MGAEMPPVRYSASVTQPIEVTQDDRTMAVLAHALQMIGGFIAPLVIFLVKRERPFVAFHALQALLLQICYLAISIVLMIAWFFMIFGFILTDAAHKNAAPPVGLFVLFPVVWLGFMACYLGVLVSAILYAIKAGRGEWAEYPVIGKWARRILGLSADPNAMV